MPLAAPRALGYSGLTDVVLSRRGAAAVPSFAIASAEPARGANSGWLALLGGVLVPVYASLAFVVPALPRIAATEPASPLIDTLGFWRAVASLPISQSDDAFGAIIVAAALLAPAAYLGALRIVWRRPATRAAVWTAVGFALVFWVTFVLALPDSNGDLYVYLAFQRVWLVHGVNPYIAPPASFPTDPILLYADPAWMQMVTPYAPVWTYLGMAVGKLVGPDIILGVLGQRVLFFGSGLLSLTLIWKILGRLNPDLRLTGLVLYAWSPVVVSKGQAHTESVMVALMLLGVFWASRHRAHLALVSLTLSALVKVVTAPLLVSYLLREWWSRPRGRAVWGTALVLAVVVLAFSPLWTGWELLWRLTKDPMSTTYEGQFSLRRLVVIPPMLALVVWATWYGRRSLPALLRGWGVVMLWFSAFLAPQGLIYYLVTLCGIVAVVDSLPIVAAATAFVCGSWVSFMLFGSGLGFDPSWRVVSLLVQYGPCGAIVLGTLWRRRRAIHDHVLEGVDAVLGRLQRTRRGAFRAAGRRAS